MTALVPVTRPTAGRLCSRGKLLVSESDLSQRILAEFREIPGTCLTIAQAARLWALDGSEAARALERLERAGILKQTAQGSYLLRSQ